MAMKQAGSGPKKQSKRGLRADVKVTKGPPFKRGCIRCGEYQFSLNTCGFDPGQMMKSSDWTESKSRWFEVAWPAHGMVGPHSDFAHYICWMKWPVQKRKEMASR